MKKFLQSVFVVSVLILSASSCKKITGEGPVVKETRSVSGYSGIHLSVPGELYYTQSNEHRIEIEAQRNILDVIETYLVNGSELRIKMKNNINIRRHEPIRIYVSSPDINNFTVSGSGNIKAAQPITSSDLRLSVSGSGNIDISRAQVNQLTGTISGSGNLEIRDGSSNNSSLNVSGSGNVNMLFLTSKKANAVISGSGSIRLHVVDELEARISGSGEVIYRGNPTVRSHVSGSGRIHPY